MKTAMKKWHNCLIWWQQHAMQFEQVYTLKRFLIHKKSNLFLELKSKTFEHNRIENLAKTIKTSNVNDSAASRSRLTSKNGASVSTEAKDIYCSTLKPLQFGSQK